jgi:hypothetical protein
MKKLRGYKTRLSSYNKADYSVTKKSLQTSSSRLKAARYLTLITRSLKHKKDLSSSSRKVPNHSQSHKPNRRISKNPSSRKELRKPNPSLRQSRRQESKLGLTPLRQ